MTSTQISVAVLQFCRVNSPTTIEALHNELSHVNNWALIDEVVAEMAEARLLRATATRHLYD